MRIERRFGAAGSIIDRRPARSIRHGIRRAEPMTASCCARRCSPDNQAEAFDAEPRMAARSTARARERGGLTMLTWHLLRAAAIARHRVVWRACGSNPVTWELHMDMIRAVYGY